MANRTGTYIAFDGLGQTDPTKSDFRYYSTLQAWAANKSIDFTFVNSHDKTYAVRDSSKRATLEARIGERLGLSKNVLMILSSETRKSGSMLCYEIEQAVDTYGLPLIAAYTDCKTILDPSAHSDRWPSALATRINNGPAKVIHVAFRQSPILAAIEQFSVHGKMPSSSLVYYSKEAHQRWGLL
ncbi:hypothetical protein LCGC14_2625900 [marine sediment metagenome]|uniref:Thoeris protein ThsB TIR-like domain-containing protein n=1 Tax=marine sediment metagenome TaxID=412755 RepID=A0A0F9CU76_9ZZZZ